MLTVLLIIPANPPSELNSLKMKKSDKHEY